MDKQRAELILNNIFCNSFNEDNFKNFIVNLFKKNYKIDNTGFLEDEIIPEKYRGFISKFKRIAEYSVNNTVIDVLIVCLKSESSLERARTKQRNFISDYLMGNFYSNSIKDAALVAFVSENSDLWRFSLVKLDLEITNAGDRSKIIEKYTPAKRWSFLVGPGEKTHTVRNNFFNLISDDNLIITLFDLENAFNVEVVTEEFFNAYKFALYKIIDSIKNDGEHNKKHSFAQLLLSRILFIYFLQKKRWLKWKDYIQDPSYLKNLWGKYKNYIKDNPDKSNTFYSIWLTSFFFGAFNKKSGEISSEIPSDIRESFINMPYLNGGLFSKTELDNLGFDSPDYVFEYLFEPDLNSNDKKKGFLEIFNFTIDEALPLDVDVAVDPEMLGKVYESLIAEEERGNVGIFYTPKIEIDLMCKLSLIEYIFNETKINKNKIIDFIFDPHNKIDLFSNDELREIKLNLEKVKVVDPACGSASFLVNMMNILVDLHSVLTKQLENREENIFALKQHIIQNNIYGVDVKDWAVMVGELRLWLSLIIETDEKFMDIYTRPLLPNLSFKILQGDSLIEEIAGEILCFRKDDFNKLTSFYEKDISSLIDMKNEVFSGKISADLNQIHQIKELEYSILTKILSRKIELIDRRISNYNNKIKDLNYEKSIFKDNEVIDKKLIGERLNELNEFIKEKEKYEKILENLKNKTKKDYFLWEINFVEVFNKNNGFDIVIGNPPYVRQEIISPPLEDPDNYSSEQWKIMKNKYKEKLVNSAKYIWKNLNIDKRSDLYLYFYYHGLSLLKKGGIFCFINSNSWLDVGYGAGLQEFLLKNMKPIYIIDNLKKRSFKQADVNTVIVLIQRPEVIIDNFVVKFIAFKKSFEEVVKPDIFKSIENANSPIFDNENYRIFPKTKNDLLLEGSELKEDENDNSISYKDFHYIGNKWGGKYLRAPEIYFKILEKGKDKFVRLGDIAEVRFGIKTGANEFFYLKPVDLTVKEVAEISEKEPDTLIKVKNSAGWEGEIEAEFLKPVIKSPRELKTIIVRLEDLNYLVFMCHKSEKELKETKALEYIKWGEKQGINKAETIKNRPTWYKLNSIISKIFILRASADRPAIYISNDYIAHDQTFYSLKLNLEKFSEEIFGLLINNSFSNFLSREIESGASSSLGLGVKWSAVYEMRNIFVPKFEINKIPSFNRLPTSIFTEFGFDPSKPIRDQEPNPLPDRKALDDIVFDALGLTEDERKEVYRAVAELVKNRLEKAKSV